MLSRMEALRQYNFWTDELLKDIRRAIELRGWFFSPQDEFDNYVLLVRKVKIAANDLIG